VWFLFSAKVATAQLLEGWPALWAGASSTVFSLTCLPIWYLLRFWQVDLLAELGPENLLASLNCLQSCY
jgi:hypothetical protein